MGKWTARLARGAAGVRYTVDAGTIALTFDDGPHPEMTPRLLDALGELDVVATFFVIGSRARRHPALVRRIITEGHGIGSHSDSHPAPGGLRGGRALSADYRRGRAVVEEAAGREIPLFRPPHGWVGPTAALAIRAGGLQPWLWSVDSLDWQGADTSVVGERLAAAGSGDVVLLHDNADTVRWEPTALLRPLVEKAERDGLRFVRLPDR